ncbi:MAG: hypothetical protein A2X57_11725 [Nitrospirae bacterium GWD2_57_8]|nr:MAG: hypothetical protein A2X57_11725 [Nitrospirae bacterium GWD2_57_8]
MVAVAIILSAAHGAAAGMILDAGVRVTYDDNPAASSSAAGVDGDVFTTVSATIGSYTELSEATRYAVFKGGIEAYSYDTYDELNGVAGFASAGLYRRYGAVLSTLLTLSGRMKDFNDNAMDGGSVGASFELFQQVRPDIRFNEWYAVERMDARDDTFSYDGQNAGIWFVLRMERSWFLHAGYSFLYRQYEEPVGSTSRSHTLSLLLERTLTRTVYAFAGWDRQRYEAEGTEEAFGNTLATIGIAYSY